MSKQKGKIFDFLDDITSNKNLSKEDIIEILNNSFIKAWQKHRGNSNIEIKITNNEIVLYKTMNVVDIVNNPLTEISAKEYGLISGQEYKEIINIENLSQRIIADIYEIFNNEIKFLSKEREFTEYLNMKGKIVKCKYLTRSYDGIIVAVDHSTRGIIDKYTNEQFIEGNNIISCLLYDVKRNNNGYQLYFDRKTSYFIKALLAEIIPDIANNKIYIEAIARIPGEKCKILISGEVSVNPISTCIGYKGQNKNLIQKELNNEIIEFVLWNPDLLTTIKLCFPKGKILEAIVENETCVLIVDDENFGEVIGKKAINVRLCKSLLYDQLNEENIKEIIIRKKSEKYNIISDEVLEEIGGDKEAIKKIINNNNYNIEDAILNYFTPEDIKNNLKIYFDQKIKPKLLEEFKRNDGSEDLFMKFDKIHSKYYFELLKHNIKTLEDLMRISPKELSEKINLDENICTYILNGI